MGKLTNIIAASTILLSSSTYAQGFADITGRESSAGSFANQGTAIRNDTASDVDMNRVSKAFDMGNSEAQDTVLNRIYDPNSTIAVRTRRYMNTLISIPVERKIKDVFAADQYGFTVSRLDNRSPHQVVVTPNAYAIDSNLVITDTDNNVYTFYLRSEPKNSQFVPHFSVVIKDGVKLNDLTIAFDAHNNPIYPGSDYTEQNGTTKLPQDKTPQRNKLSKKEYDFLRELEGSHTVNVDYTMYGERTIAPNAVWDDGQQTYISFRDGTPSQRIPNLYRVVDGYAVIANYHYKDGFIVVDAISHEGWMLIDGTKTVCIKSPKFEQTNTRHVDIKELELMNEASEY